MKNLKIFFSIFVALLLFNTAFGQNKYYGKVVEVLDGRTLVIEPQPKVQIKIELQYIEVPEAEQAFSSTVKDHLSKMVLGKIVEFEPKTQSETRTTGQVYLKGVDLSQQMLRDGAAWYAVLEKNLQDDNESEIYQNNERQAKAEKRGIWSVADLKPAWEFRAEKAEKEESIRQAEKRRQEEAEELAKAENRNQPERNSVHRRQTAEERQRANANVKIWADVSDFGFLTSSNILSRLDNLPEASEPLTGYDVKSGRSYMATPLSVLNVSYRDKELKILGMLMYFSPGSDEGNKESHYLLGVLSEAAEEKFANARKLTIITEKRKIVSNGAKRLVDKVPNGVRERMYYGLSKEDLQSIKTAKRLRVGLGNYRGNVDEAFLKKIQTLLNKLD